MSIADAVIADDLNEHARAIEKLRTDLLFGDTGDCLKGDGFAECEFLAALAALDLAQRHMRLASLHKKGTSNV